MALKLGGERSPRTVATVAVSGRPIAFSMHAATRWRERCRPAVTTAQAIRELLIAVAAQGAVKRRRPRGIEYRTLRAQLITVGWLTVDEAVFPLVIFGGQLVATTCIERKDIR